MTEYPYIGVSLYRSIPIKEYAIEKYAYTHVRGISIYGRIHKEGGPLYRGLSIWKYPCIEASL